MDDLAHCIFECSLVVHQWRRLPMPTTRLNRVKRVGTCQGVRGGLDVLFGLRTFLVAVCRAAFIVERRVSYY